MRRPTVALSALAIFVAGCGGGDSKTADEWAAEACPAMTSWYAGWDEHLGSGWLPVAAEWDVLVPAGDLDGGRDLVLSYYADLGRLADDAVETLMEIGIPDVDGGAEVMDEIVRYLEGLKASLSAPTTLLSEAPDEDLADLGADELMEGLAMMWGFALGEDVARNLPISVPPELSDAVDGPGCEFLAWLFGASAP